MQSKYCIKQFQIKILKFKIQMVKNNYIGCIKFLRDSAGIAGFIDVSKIYKYYIKICFRNYMDVINKQF